ncbi:MAG: hypothetical protein IKO93_22550 [Lentisphaeria bacterium]|nr:hypothetical protein [Lentisphaeria bacterium]
MPQPTGFFPQGPLSIRQAASERRYPRPEAIDVKFTANGAELTLQADTDKFADHTFHVELIDGSGKINPAFNDVVLGKGNKAFYRFRKPLNAKGQWKLQVREALTSAEKTVDLP